MGRYANRFVAGGSNTIGATFTAADGGGNTAYSVVANGQSLSRTDYPSLARLYSGQTEFDTLKITAPATATANETWVYGTGVTNTVFSYGGGQTAAYYSNFLLYKQGTVTNLPGLTGPYHAFWYTEDAENWKLVDFPARQIGSSAGLVVTTGGIYVCHESGLHKTTNGTTFTDLYPSGVYTVADLGPTTVFVTGGTGIVKTNDFVNFTGVNIASGFTVRTLVVHSGVLYAFSVAAANATGVYYSTDTGNTWTKATSGTVTGVGYHVVSTGGYLVASTYTVDNNTPVFQYSTNPTGTTNTWTASTQTKSGADGDGGVCPSHVIYDSGTNNLVYCLHYRLDNTSGIFAYTFSGITGARLTYTGLGNALLPFGIGTGRYQDTFAVNIGGKRGFCIGPLATALPNPSGTTWSGVFSFTTNSAIENYRPNPFFHVSTTYTGGYYTLGTTNSGTRYIFKGTSANNSAIAQMGVFVEDSGFFKPLKATSTGEFALLDNCGQASAGYSEPDVCLAEASGRYILAFSSSGTSYSGIYYNTYSQSTRRSTATGGVYRGYSASNSILGATKSNGIYVFISGNIQLNNSNQPLVLAINPQGSINFVQATNTFTGGNLTYNFSNLTNNVIISATSTSGTTSGVAYTFDGSNFIRNDYILLNSTGGVVTPLSGTHILQSNGKYYAVDPSGVIYKGTSLTTLTFNNYTNKPPTGTATNSVKRYTEISQTRTIGNASIVVNDFAGLNFNQVHTNPDSSTFSNINRVDVWRFSGSSTYVVNAANRWAGALAQTSGSGSFTVPNITGNVPGQAVYIIAR